jgi:hypothetical protein
VLVFGFDRTPIISASNDARARIFHRAIFNRQTRKVSLRTSGLTKFAPDGSPDFRLEKKKCSWISIPTYVDLSDVETLRPRRIRNEIVPLKVGAGVSRQYHESQMFSLNYFEKRGGGLMFESG